MKRWIRKEAKDIAPTSTLVCCIEDDYNDVLFIDKQIRSTERFIITNEKSFKGLDEDEKEKLEDVIDKLRKSHLTDDDRTTIVRSDLHDFDNMMHTILMIVEDRLRFVDNVYLDITNGTGEFSSAAIILAMSYDRVQVMSVRISRTAMNNAETGNKPGLKPLYSEMKEISQIKGFELELPNPNLIRALQIYNNIPRGKKTSTEVIKGLLEDGVWFELKETERPEKGGDKTSLDIQNPKLKSDEEKKIVYREKNFYQRNILGKWIDKGWVKKNDRAAGGYEIADEGLHILSIFTGDIGGLDSYILINEEKN